MLNGSTRFDFTNYFAVVPSHKLETLLWAEADRMRGLDITCGCFGDETPMNYPVKVAQNLGLMVVGGLLWWYAPKALADRSEIRN